MARHPRNTNPKYIRHISIRTEQAALLLLPDERLNQIIGGILAKYQEAFSIIIYAYTVLGNHIHMIARAPMGNLWRFEQAVNREIARRTNVHRNRRGHFWERRYDEQIIAEENDILEAFLYVVCNAVRHGIVDHPILWKGINCYSHVIDESDRTYKFTNYTEYRRALNKAKNTGETVLLSDYQTEHKLKISPIPQYEKLSQRDRKAKMIDIIKSRILRIRKERKKQGLGFLPQDKFAKQRFTDIPRNVKRLPKPICWTKDIEAKRRFMEWYFSWLEAYQKASKLFRSGKFKISFPEYSLLPPMHYVVA